MDKTVEERIEARLEMVFRDGRQAGSEARTKTAQPAKGLHTSGSFFREDGRPSSPYAELFDSSGSLRMPPQDVGRKLVHDDNATASSDSEFRTDSGSGSGNGSGSGSGSGSESYDETSRDDGEADVDNDSEDEASAARRLRELRQRARGSAVLNTVMNLNATSRTSRATHICPQCSKAFGKSTKLERHLLQFHAATLSIPSHVLTAPTSTTPPPADATVAASAPHIAASPAGSNPSNSSATPYNNNPNSAEIASANATLAVRRTLEAALCEANRSFDAGSSYCRLCASVRNRRSFATRKDLAAHLVAKHVDDHMRVEDGAVLAAVPSPSPSPTSLSARSHAKRPASTDASTPPAAKRARLSAPSREDACPASGTKPPITPRKARPVVAPKTQALAACVAAVPPPVATPAVTASTDAAAVVVVEDNDAEPAVVKNVAPRQAEAAAAAVLDFSAMAGIFANKHKSYYRFVDA